MPMREPDSQFRQVYCRLMDHEPSQRQVMAFFDADPVLGDIDPDYVTRVLYEAVDTVCPEHADLVDSVIR